MGSILSQTGGTSATGDLTTAIGNARLSALCRASNGTVDTAAVSAVISDAEAETLSILGPSFNVAATSTITKNIVKLHCKDIAIYRCYCRVPEFRNDRGETVVTPQYEKAIAGLEKIASGERDMGDESVAGKSALVGGTVNFSTKSFIVEANEASTGPTGGF